MTPTEQIAFLEEVQTQIAIEIARLKQPSKWQPQGGDWTIEPTDIHLSYPSRETAEAVIPKLRTYTRLLAYVQEFDITDEPKDRIIGYDKAMKRYCISTAMTFYSPTDVFMSKACADALCDKLNSNEVML